MRSPFRYFNSSPELIRLAVMMYIRYPLSLRQVEDLLFERHTDICHEAVRFWWNRFGPLYAAEIWRRRIAVTFVTVRTPPQDRTRPQTAMRARLIYNKAPNAFALCREPPARRASIHA